MGLMMIGLMGARGRLLGIITLAFAESGRRYGADELALTEELAHRIGLTIDNARLFAAEALARKEAELANEIKLRFLATISHELRTPLTSIKGFATTLLATDVTWDAENQRDFIAIINQESDKLTDLIEQLLDLSRLQAGTLRIHPESCSLTTIIGTAMAQLDALTVQHRL